MAPVVLLVDDDALVRAVAALMLEDLGCEVVTAAGGRHAIDTLVADDRIEILITDVNMPDMDGFAVAQAATRMRKELKVIILSGRERGFSACTKAILAGRPQTNNGAAYRPLLSECQNGRSKAGLRCRSA